jgi:hypothetical protein
MEYTALKVCAPKARGLPPVFTVRLAVLVVPEPLDRFWADPIVLLPS